MSDWSSGDDLGQICCESTEFTLATTGITVCEPEGPVEYANGSATIGSLVDTDGLIELLPRIGLTASQFERLLLTAVQVWIFGRVVLGEWTQLGASWVADVTMGYPEFFGLRRAARSRLSEDGLTTRV